MAGLQRRRREARCATKPRASAPFGAIFGHNWGGRRSSELGVLGRRERSSNLVRLVPDLVWGRRFWGERKEKKRKKEKGKREEK